MRSAHSFDGLSELLVAQKTRKNVPKRRDSTARDPLAQGVLVAVLMGLVCGKDGCPRVLEDGLHALKGFVDPRAKGALNEGVGHLKGS